MNGSLGVGMLGYAFMGRAHSRALRALAELDPPLRPELVSLSGRNREAAGEAAARYGWGEVCSWEEQVADPRVELFDNGGPNALHAEPTIAAARAGKHVLCEKPLGRDAAESHAIWRAAADAGVVHMCGFNYRFVPAVRLARELVERGELGRIVHFRARYLQSWGWEAPGDAWRFDRVQAGTGALGDLGAHIVDLARYLVGEIVSVSAEVRTYVEGREVDDAFVATVEFANGAIGTLEASRLARGRPNSNAWELNGEDGSLAFDVERLNELEVADGPGFRRVLVTEPEHPFMRFWWPPGHIVGWGDSFTHELHHLLGAIAAGGSVRPHGADFEDGYRCAEVCDAILRSAASGRRERVAYRG
ncbi:MAG TPA: Gfo/Idh/MocA family oxidoreductase [Gaiellaceae bacterium]|nr:Gfo/Idh/MocA family oxidoreductase [Gaiellaceae bacterium]